MKERPSPKFCLSCPSLYISQRNSDYECILASLNKKAEKHALNALEQESIDESLSLLSVSVAPKMLEPIPSPCPNGYNINYSNPMHKLMTIEGILKKKNG